MIITPLSWEYVKAFGFYEKGYLPNGSGWNNESNKLVQAVSVLENEFNKVKNKKNGNVRTRHSPQSN